MRRTFRVRSRRSGFARLLDKLERSLQEANVDADSVREMRLVAEEAVSNVIYYAYPDGAEPWLELTAKVDDLEIRLDLRDRGRPFDPLAHPAPDLEAPLAERPEGGLGIHLIRALVDEAHYSREGGYNRLLLVKRR